SESLDASTQEPAQDASAQDWPNTGPVLTRPDLSTRRPTWLKRATKPNGRGDVRLPTSDFRLKLYLRVAITSARSGGRGDSKTRASPVVGWVKASRVAWRNIRGTWIRSGPGRYRPSPTRG